MKGFLRKLRKATTDENFGIELKRMKMYNITATFRNISTGNTHIVSSNRYFTNEDLAKRFCRMMNESCKKYEKDNETYITQKYDYDECELKIYDYFD